MKRKRSETRKDGRNSERLKQEGRRRRRMEVRRAEGGRMKEGGEQRVTGRTNEEEKQK